MITQFVLNIFVSIINFFIGLLPNVTSLPDSFNDFINFIISFFGNMVYIFPPFEAVYTILGIIITIEISILTWKSFDYIYNKIRGSG